jgi:hypothetical protein
LSSAGQRLSARAALTSDILDRVRTRIARGLLVLLLISFVGLLASILLNLFVLDEFEFDTYGEVPIPGTGTVHLPAGDVKVSFFSESYDVDRQLPIPQNLELVITAPNGAAQPSLTDKLGGTTNIQFYGAHRQVKVAHIPAADDYTIATNGDVTPFAKPRLAFGHPNRFWLVTWIFAGLCALNPLIAATYRLAVSRSASGRTGSAAGPPTSDADTGVRSNLAAARSDVPPPAVQPIEQTEDPAELEQRRQNWAAIDSLVQEFIPEAVRRKTPMKRFRLRGWQLIFTFRMSGNRYWLLQHAQSERDMLVIRKNGEWSFNRINSAGKAETLAFSMGSRRRECAGPNPVDGLREGAMRLLNSR